jgi:hypothetical protein
MSGDVELERAARIAHADVWEAEGLMRAAGGGAAAELRDMRLMASGLPDARWNSAQVTGPNPDIHGAQAFYRERRLPWGLRLPAQMPFSHGRFVVRLRLMALRAPRFQPVEVGAGLDLALAGPDRCEQARGPVLRST